MARIKATHHMVFIVARVHGTAVTDCMRYDSCCPANEEHAHKLSRAMEGNPDWVVFKRFVAVGAPVAPNAARWKSFNIPCVPSVFETVQDAEARIKEIDASGGKLYENFFASL